MRTETINYRDYELQAVHNLPFWQVSIYPTMPHLLAPSPDAQTVSLGDKEAAFAEAQRRVDALISKQVTVRSLSAGYVELTSGAKIKIFGGSGTLRRD
jgi:hypothetical protein